jgi:hypothetical protein
MDNSNSISSYNLGTGHIKSCAARYQKSGWLKTGTVCDTIPNTVICKSITYHSGVSLVDARISNATQWKEVSEVEADLVLPISHLLPLHHSSSNPNSPLL